MGCSSEFSVFNRNTLKEIIATLDYNAPSCPDFGKQIKKYDFQKTSKIPHLETTGIPTRLLLKNAILIATLLKNSGYSEEKSPNSSYYQSKNRSKTD